MKKSSRIRLKSHHIYRKAHALAAQCTSYKWRFVSRTLRGGVLYDTGIFMAADGSCRSSGPFFVAWWEMERQPSVTQFCCAVLIASRTDNV